MDADYRSYCESRLAITIAGWLAKQRALQGSSPGWRRARSREELTAYHEAGHAVVAATVEFFVQRVYVVQEPQPGGVAGACVSSFTPPQPTEDPEQYVVTMWDSRIARGLCWTLAGDAPTWKSALAIYREFKAKVQGTIERHWLAISDLAEALLRGGDLRRDEIAAVLARNGIQGT